MTNRLLTLAVIGAVGAGSAATVATAHQGRGHVGVARTQIATVSSYTAKTLTLKTTGGVTITGTVSGRTRIQCLPLATSGTTPTPTTSPEPTPTETTPETTPPSPSFRRGDDDGDRSGAPARRAHWNDDGDEDSDVCDTSLLTSGQGVIAASTELTASGQKFTRIVLVSTTSSSDDDTTS